MTSLKDRAHGTAVEKREDNTLRAQIQKMETQFAMAMPKGMEAAQLVRDALTCLRQNPKLAECSPDTVLGGLMTCAQLGLRPGVLGHAWLLPFWDTKSRGHKAQLVIGYQGYKDLAFRSGQIASLIARTVFENDVFEVDYGLSDNLIHKPTMSGDRGQPVAYYAIAKFAGGGHAFIVMSQDDMEKHRDQYAMAKTKDGRVVGPWRDQFEGMAHKTCVRQLAKWMPMSTEFATAIQADEGVRVNLSPSADVNDVTHHYDDAIDGEVISDSADGSESPSGQGDDWPAAAQPGGDQ